MIWVDFDVASGRRAIGFRVNSVEPWLLPEVLRKGWPVPPLPGNKSQLSRPYCFRIWVDDYPNFFRLDMFFFEPWRVWRDGISAHIFTPVASLRCDVWWRFHGLLVWWSRTFSCRKTHPGVLMFFAKMSKHTALHGPSKTQVKCLDMIYLSKSNNLNTFDILGTWTWIQYAIWFNMFSCYLAKQNLKSCSFWNSFAQVSTVLDTGKFVWALSLSPSLRCVHSYPPFTDDGIHTSFPIPAPADDLHIYVYPVQQASVLLPTGSFDECR